MFIPHLLIIALTPLILTYNTQVAFTPTPRFISLLCLALCLLSISALTPTGHHLQYSTDVHTHCSPLSHPFDLCSRTTSMAPNTFLRCAKRPIRGSTRPTINCPAGCHQTFRSRHGLTQHLNAIPDSKSRIPRIPLLLPNRKLQKYLSLHPLHSISPHHSWHPLTGLLLWHPLTDLLLLHPPALMSLVLSRPLTGLILLCPLMSILLLPLSFSLMHLCMLPLTLILILILSVDFLSRLLTQLPTHHLACHLTHLLAHLLTHHPIRRQACHQACHRAHLLVLPLIPISWMWT